MHWSLPVLLCVTIASLHYSTEAKRFSNSRYLLGKALLRRAREINESKSNGDVLEDEMSEEEREKVLQTDALEDIFVGSGNHVYESQGKSETSGSRREETSASDESEADEAGENDSSPTSGDSNAGEGSDNDESDEDENEKSEDDDDDDEDGTETKKDQESQENANDEDTSASGLIESENAARRSPDISGSGSGSEQQNDATEQSGSGESTMEGAAPAAASQVEASGTDENAAKKSEIDTASGDSQDEDEESGSTDVIKKGIESLSRLLTPVASGYEFELYSGNTEKNDKEEETEAEGESEKGVSSDTEEVHVKKCKRVCEDPMTYEQCAVPRCDYKMGTIKDLCIYLCKHQTPVCRQQCE